jgi:hypothetical protein
MFNLKLAYVPYIHIYLEQDNHIENVTSLKIILSNDREEGVKKRDIIFVCFRVMPHEQHTHQAST